jgi:hypothetical protein
MLTFKKTQSMKKILLSLAFIASIGLANKMQAQCTLSNVTVNLNSANPDGFGNCIVNFDLAFDIDNNGGNKYIWLNLWKSTDYNFNTFDYGAGGAKAPKWDELDGVTNLNDPIGIVGINNDVAPPVFLATYPADPTNVNTGNGRLVVGTSLTRTVVGTNFHFVLTGLQFTIPGPCAGLILQGDVWSSQSNSANAPIHCYSEGISFFGDPTINGGIFCVSPRQAVVLLNTVSTGALSVQYTVYVDQGVIGTFDGDPLAKATTGPISLSAATPYNSGPFTYIGGNSNPTANQPLLVVLDVLAPFTKSISANIFNSCIPLPVQFNAFTATRNQSNVVLKWSTIWEQNSAGFAVERNTNGTWQQVAYVPTQAVGGNSSDLLNYQHIDANNTKGISQYRIQQVDLDGRSKYSEIRSVRGLSQMGQVVVFPNPSSDGKVNVSFEDAATRDISVSDLSGRVIRQIQGVSSNSITIENLTPAYGFR